MAPRDVREQHAREGRQQLVVRLVELLRRRVVAHGGVAADEAQQEGVRGGEQRGGHAREEVGGAVAQGGPYASPPGEVPPHPHHAVDDVEADEARQQEPDAVADGDVDVVLRPADEDEEGDDAHRLGHDVEHRDVFHVLHALEEPHREHDVAHDHPEVEQVEGRLGAELVEPGDERQEDDEARPAEERPPQHGAVEVGVDGAAVVAVLGDVFRGREVEAEVGEHHEVLHQRVAERHQSPSLHAQHAEQEREGDERQHVVHPLQEGERYEVDRHRVSHLAFE